MDQRAFLWANRLLDNAPNSPALEATLGGLEIGFETATVIALTGADCEATVDGSAVGNWRTVRVAAGQTLRLGYSSSGMRAYVAFPGGLHAPTFFGSASVVIREGLPAPLDRGLEAGHRLSWGTSGISPAAPARSVPVKYISELDGPLVLPLIAGYEWDEFSEEDRLQLTSTAWTVDSASDRIACRLFGSELLSGPRALDSVPLVDGTVQVPGDGAPLVFMRDRPTIGGYAKLGSVDPLALDLLAQARPGSGVRFVLADPAEVRARLQRRDAFFGLQSI